MGMLNPIVQLHYDFYQRLEQDKKLINYLYKENIQILDGFIKEVQRVNQYYEMYYPSDPDRIVLCGINPGRNGAGKTGIPFIDFRSLSCLIPDTKQDDCESSAEFIYSIISEIGVRPFYQHVYMTNLSWFGFVKDGRNLNYYKLPEKLIHVFTSSFIEEMKMVKPKAIIPLSIDVEKSLKKMKQKRRLTFPLVERLPHPYYCSIQSHDSNKYSKIYVEKIKSLI